MVELSKFNGKKVKVSYEDGSQIEAIAEEYMYGDDFDEEFNSLALTVTKVIKEREMYPFGVYVGHDMMTAIYENENVEIEEI
jgi:hypothetical protein